LAERNGLDETQRATLDDLARSLGVPPAIRDPCPLLASVLGGEWAEAAQYADALAQRARDEAQSRALLRQLREGRVVRSVRARTLPDLAAAAFPWENLPPEVRAIVVERLVETDPAAVLSLYRSNAQARDLIDRIRRPLLVADERGDLAQIRAPLIDYVRLVLATGLTDPLDIFLRAALCTLVATADALYGDDIDVSDELSDADIVPYGPSGNPLYAALVTGGLTEDEFLRWLGTPEGEQALASHGQNIATVRDIVVGPISQNLAGAVGAWWEWLSRGRGAPLATVPGLRYATILGATEDAIDEQRLREDMANDVSLGPIPYGPSNSVQNVASLRSAWMDWDAVRGLLADRVPPSVIDRWLVTPPSRGPVTDEMQAGAARGPPLGPVVIHAFGERVRWRQHNGEEGVCRAISMGSDDSNPAQFGRLFARSDVWIGPGFDYTTVHLSIGFASPALDRALDLARRRALQRTE
jgi:hypothetical protein